MISLLSRGSLLWDQHRTRPPPTSRRAVTVPVHSMQPRSSQISPWKSKYGDKMRTSSSTSQPEPLPCSHFPSQPASPLAKRIERSSLCSGGRGRPSVSSRLDDTVRPGGGRLSSGWAGLSDPSAVRHASLECQRWMDVRTDLPACLACIRGGGRRPAPPRAAYVRMVRYVRRRARGISTAHAHMSVRIRTYIRSGQGAARDVVPKVCMYKRYGTVRRVCARSAHRSASQGCRQRRRGGGGGAASHARVTAAASRRDGTRWRNDPFQPPPSGGLGFDRGYPLGTHKFP
ncbi:hypothetical protein F4780DRAFT_756945 [Xylariomycetidae sp. FL0641]|nr:hypothetical protein F4780DRAFT_756945 [Xylariomycetidae sp. FL0641]